MAGASSSTSGSSAFDDQQLRLGQSLKRVFSDMKDVSGAVKEEAADDQSQEDDNDEEELGDKAGGEPSSVSVITNFPEEPNKGTFRASCFSGATISSGDMDINKTIAILCARSS